jgi:hypothetical protein
MDIAKDSGGRHVLATLCNPRSGRPSGTSRLNSEVAKAVEAHSACVRVVVAGSSLQGPISAALLEGVLRRPDEIFGARRLAVGRLDIDAGVVLREAVTSRPR